MDIHGHERPRHTQSTDGIVLSAVGCARHMELAGMRVGITFSTFDLLHAGHVQMLREAKSKCDYLIVGLQIDPTVDRAEKNKPIQTVVERYTQLKGVKYVDEIIPYCTENDVCDILELYDINIRILGEEYKHKVFTGKEICQRKGIELYFNKREHRFSSTDLRTRLK